MHPLLINGEWRPSQGKATFRAVNPAKRQPFGEEFPISPWEDVEEALVAADRAFDQVKTWPGARFADFLESYAAAIELRAAEIVSMANLETALPVSPRLKDVELPRTLGQLRQAAAAARDGSWKLPTLDTAANIRSYLGPIGPVAVFGPNNFPCAFNSMAGGDFAAAVAAGNPVIAKGHPLHPQTTQLFAEAAHEAAEATDMPRGFVQLIYHTDHENGARLVSHPLLAASGYTGSRQAGLILKSAADQHGKPFYAELSSVNPVYILPGVLEEKLDALAAEFATSALMGTGQFCTNPGVVLLKKGPLAEKFISAVATKFGEAPVGTLLGESTEVHLRAGIVALQRAGATIVTGNKPVDNSRYCYSNTLLKVAGNDFLADPIGLQTEAFGNAALIIVVEDDEQFVEITRHIEGSLTGCVYSSTNGRDDALYEQIEPVLRQKVGRLLNDKMPTGVAVSPAMNHGGPFPATCHPGFTAVGIPASLRRFGMLQCYDNVRADRLPPLLRNENPGQTAWRLIDGKWTQADVNAAR
ncbi:aldehyde dehydrogenase (NADP(+)) [Planctomicrobium piriforme]|uniref:NADP-dependent aldehyde dehydrogenase n=1 Tax=Planctomicrobium piriforme TaxID=1576369 RepID=A0A1I3FSA1_9PLAN|nr:aldehyde dehydrogenase (NADP(+)) [Planctomicrobium piriforme]SFI13997.1 NADP-dependent aldehyde dehydrogenase [Planctomicrobium piriforme]